MRSALLATRKFSELPVVDRNGRPVGLVDVTDVVGLKAEDVKESARREPLKPTKSVEGERANFSDRRGGLSSDRTSN